MKTALTIAGSDPSGGAGIQADLKTFSVLGVYGMSAITAITVQNTLGVTDSLEIIPELVRKQIDAVSGDIQPDACKSGMLGSVALIEVVEDCIKRNQLRPYVCDPVMVSKAGSELLERESVKALRKKLLPLATIVTPNRFEAAVLLDTTQNTIADVASAREAARRIAGMGAAGVVVKGIDAGEQIVDVFFDGRDFVEFAAQKQSDQKTHGSGCAFSAAIAGGLANRMTLLDAIDQAKQLVNTAIQHSDGQGRGIAPVNVLAFVPKKK